MPKKSIDMPGRDELAEILVGALNKNKNDSNVAFFLDGTDETPVDLIDFVSTGATVLDIAIANRPHGGLPVGRIVEISGLEGSGKSLVSATVIANAQKAGGIGVLIDTESAVNKDFFQAIGLDLNKLVYINLTTVEEIFDTIEALVEKIRKANKDKLVVIVVDSVTGASTKRELESTFDKEGYNTDKSQIVGKALRKLTNVIARQKILLIFTNQLRMKLNAMPFSDPYTTSGGMAIQFATSVRLRLALTKKIKNTEGDVVGTSVKAEVRKNRVGPPNRIAEFDIYYDRGIDDLSFWLKILKDLNVIKNAGGWSLYTDENGTEHKFRAKDFEEFLKTHEDLKNKFYEMICDHLIMKYKTYDLELLDFVDSD